MKKQLLIAASLAVAVGAFAQGSVNFQNRVTGGGGGAQGGIIAPIYGMQVGDPLRELHGNTATGFPVGSQTYTGPLLAGTGFTVQLWGGPGTENNPDNLQLGTTPGGTATTTFRTGTGAGFVVALADAVVIPGAPAGAGNRANLQVRAWDNLGGTITTWAAVMAAQGVVPHGDSGIFSPNFDLGGAATLPPNLIGLTSFNLHIVPEPSVIALGVLGLGALLFRRRK
jgi:hypothetical protein